MTPELLGALTRLHAWKAVRPGSDWLKMPTDVLEAQGLAKRIPTLIGVGLTLSVQGRAALGISRMPNNEAMMSGALYVQDARDDLARAGFTQLRPGRGVFRVVTGPGGKPFPVLARVLKGGYSAKRIRQHMESLEPDLLARGVHLVLVHPTPECISHPRLRVIHSPPQWPA